MPPFVFCAAPFQAIAEAAVITFVVFLAGPASVIACTVWLWPIAIAYSQDAPNRLTARAIALIAVIFITSPVGFFSCAAPFYTIAVYAIIAVRVKNTFCSAMPMLFIAWAFTRRLSRRA